MSKVRVLVGHTQGRIHTLLRDGKREKWGP